MNSFSVHKISSLLLAIIWGGYVLTGCGESRVGTPAAPVTDSTTAAADSVPAPAEPAAGAWSGQFADGTPLEMELEMQQREARGWLIFPKTGARLALSGSLQPDDHFSWQARDTAGTLKGRLSGRFVSDTRAEGDYTSLSSTDENKFTLTRHSPSTPPALP